MVSSSKTWITKITWTSNNNSLWWTVSKTQWCKTKCRMVQIWWTNNKIQWWWTRCKMDQIQTWWDQIKWWTDLQLWTKETLWWMDQTKWWTVLQLWTKEIQWWDLEEWWTALLWMAHQLMDLQWWIWEILWWMVHKWWTIKGQIWWITVFRWWTKMVLKIQCSNSKCRCSKMRRWTKWMDRWTNKIKMGRCFRITSQLMWDNRTLLIIPLWMSTTLLIIRWIIRWKMEIFN